MGVILLLGFILASFRRIFPPDNYRLGSMGAGNERRRGTLGTRGSVEKHSGPGGQKQPTTRHLATTSTEAQGHPRFLMVASPVE